MTLPRNRGRVRRLPAEQRRGQLLANAIGVSARRGLGGGRHAEGSIATLTAPEDSARIAIGTAYLIVQMKVTGRAEEEIERFLEALTRALGARVCLSTTIGVRSVSVEDAGARVRSPGGMIDTSR